MTFLKSGLWKNLTLFENFHFSKILTFQKIGLFEKLWLLFKNCDYFSKIVTTFQKYGHFKTFGLFQKKIDFSNNCFDFSKFWLFQKLAFSKFWLLEILTFQKGISNKFRRQNWRSESQFILPGTHKKLKQKWKFHLDRRQRST